MGFAEFIKKLRERNKERKQLFKEMEDRMRVEELLNERKKSANERELERLLKEEKEEKIKSMLEKLRKKRQMELRFKHNPINIPNITNKTSWEVLKEKNLFKGKSDFISNQPFILKSDLKMFQNNKNLFK